MSCESHPKDVAGMTPKEIVETIYYQSALHTQPFNRYQLSVILASMDQYADQQTSSLNKIIKDSGIIIIEQEKQIAEKDKIILELTRKLELVLSSIDDQDR